MLHNIIKVVKQPLQSVTQPWTILQQFLTISYLVNEGGKAVVEALDLVFLFGADDLDCGVNLKVQRGQKTLVHADGSDGGHAPSKAHTQASCTTHARADTVRRAAGHSCASITTSVGLVGPTGAEASSRSSVGAAAEVSRRRAPVGGGFDPERHFAG